MKFINRILTYVFLSCLLLACSPSDHNQIRIGTVSGPETELVETAREVLKKEHISLQIVEFTDYTLPNTALYDGSIDINMFQHLPYLEVENKARGYDLVPIGKTFVYPMGLYSKKYKRLIDIPNESIVAIPNDPTNEARALLLLHAAGLITINTNNILSLTPREVKSNPKSLQFKELDAAQLTRTLSDVALAVINTNYAIPAGIIPKRDALFLESKDSPYANIIVAKKSNAQNPRLLEVVKALQSKAVLEKANQLFKEQAIPAWN